MRRVALIFAAFGLCLMIAAPAWGEGVPVQPGAASTYDFASASVCQCHDVLSAQWRDSMHSIALYDPVFRAKVSQAQAESGQATADFCLRCHSPIGNIVGDPTGATSVGAAEGVTCMFCHQVVGDTGAHANVSQLLVPDGTRRAQLMYPAAPHKAAYDEYLHTSEFCGGCHDVLQPQTGAVLDSTYREWAGSSFAKKGVRCQDCHMSDAPSGQGPATGKAAIGGPTRDNLFGMTFIGANVAQGPTDASTAMLRRAAVVNVEAPSLLRPATSSEITVTVFNRGAGHSLPTGSAERQMWLTVWSVDANGRRTVIGTKSFGVEFQNAQGEHPVEIWDASGVYSDTRIPADGKAVLTVPYTMPAGADVSVIAASLQYKSLPDDLAKKGAVGNPVTTIAADTAPIYGNEGAQRQGAAVGTEQPPAPPEATIWTPILVGLTFAGAMLVLSVVIITAQGVRGRRRT